LPNWNALNTRGSIVVRLSSRALPGSSTLTSVVVRNEPPRKAQGKSTEINERMLYFFRRAEDVIKCEIRLDWDGDGYELVIEAPHDVRVERFREPTALNERWAELERQLAGDGWSEPRGDRG
jgi:hypothetical protein